MTEREENSRILAEWVGFRYVEDSEAGTPQWHSPECKCEAIASQDECTCIESCYWVATGPPDFYTDETANAMLLDKLLSIGGFVLRSFQQAEGQHLAAYFWNDIVTHSAAWKDAIHGTDRKAIVCAAAILIARPA